MREPVSEVLGWGLLRGSQVGGNWVPAWNGQHSRLEKGVGGHLDRGLSRMSLCHSGWVMGLGSLRYIPSQVSAVPKPLPQVGPQALGCGIRDGRGGVGCAEDIGSYIL